MNNFRKCICISLFAMVTSGFVSLGAQAGESASHGPAHFSEFDTDGSGFVSEEEFNTTRGQRMAAKAAEGKQMRGAASAPAFSDIDTDGDGLLSPEELAIAQKAHMKQMGKGEHKGKGKGERKCQGKGEHKCQGKCEPVSKAGHKGQGKGMKGKMPGFADFDLDGDGKIIESEFNEAHAKKMSEMAAAGHKMKHVGDAPGFSGIDTNSDGEISEQEFATHQAEHHKKMHKGKGQSK